MKPIRFHKSATAELDKAAETYEAALEGLGHDLLSEVAPSLKRIRQLPQLHSVHKNTGFRKCVLRRGWTMSRFKATSITVAGETRNQDRLAVLDFADRLVIVVADGAGGSGGGDEAAETVIREVSTAASEPRDAESWCRILRQIDDRIPRGESTCVIAELSDAGIQGASVGDSSAWLVCDGTLSDLTSGQVRKPLLGSTRAQPIGFSSEFSRGLLIISTDGFSKYVKREAFLQELHWLDFAVLARRLVEMVRLPSGQLWDDVSIVACRRRPAVGRKRYTLSDAD